MKQYVCVNCFDLFPGFFFFSTLHCAPCLRVVGQFAQEPRVVLPAERLETLSSFDIFCSRSLQVNAHSI